MLGRIFSWLSPLQSLELSGVNPINNELFGICTSPIIHFVCHPKFCTTFVFNFSWVWQSSKDKLGASGVECGWCANVDRICRKRELPQVWGWLWYPINLLSEITLFRFIFVRSSEWNFRSVYFDPFHLSVGSKTAHAYRKRSILFQKHKVWRIERIETRAQDSRPVQSNLLTDHFLLTIGDKGRKREMRNLKKRANKTIYPRNFWRRRKEIQVLERCR